MVVYERKAVNQVFDSYLKEIEDAQAQVTAQKPMLGYPLNCHRMDELMPLHMAMNCNNTLNNCGDPMDEAEKPWRFNTLKQEGILVKKLMEGWGGTPNDTWGYITTGGTEGVTQGVSFGYERLKARGYKHILCVYNEVSHYSIPKAFKLAAPDCNTVTVEVNDLNAMKLSKVEEVLRSARTLGVDAILMCCTLGTTFWGGADDIRGLRSLMHENGYSGNSAYIHVDGAFGGGFWRDDKQLPQYQIGKDFDSISVSGHKWYGGFIAGSFLATKKGEAASSGKSVEYVDMVDKFISGSRSGAPAVLWLARFKQFDWPAELQRCYGNRDFLTKELRSLGLKVGGQYINCLMPRPSAETAKKWQLMCVGDEAQVLLLPHVSRSVLEEFLEDIKKDVAAGKMATPTARLQRVNESQI